MSDALIPPPEHAPPSVMHLTPEDRVRMWFDLLDESDALVRAGLRARIGEEGDLDQAYREWLARKMEQHDADLRQMLLNLSEREDHHGG